MSRRLAWGVLLSLGLSACSSWVGENEAPPLPGKRLSVLGREKALEAEPTDGLVGISLPPPAPNADWPQAGGYSNHAMHHMVAADNLQKAWSVSVGSGAGSRSRLLAQPVVAEGMVFTLDAGMTAQATDAKSGDQIWRTSLLPEGGDPRSSNGGLSYEGGRIFAATSFAQVVALEAKTGKEVWRQSLSGPMRGAPTLRNGRLFITTVDNQTYALNATDGATVWTHQGIAETASLLSGTSPAVDADVVVIPYSSGELFALRADNGVVLWQDQLAAVRRTTNVAAISDIRGRPVIDRGRVYAIGHANMVVAIDERSGRRLWEREIGGLQNPWIAGETLFLIDNDNEVVALHTDTGRVLWVTPLKVWGDEKNRSDRVSWVGPVLVSDRLLVAGSTGEILSLSPYTGKIMGRKDEGDKITLPPAIAGGSLYFLTNNATLVAYR